MTGLTGPAGNVHGLEAGPRSERRPNLQLGSLEKKGALAADLVMVITVSQSMKQELIQLGVPDQKIRVCYHDDGQHQSMAICPVLRTISKMNRNEFMRQLMQKKPVLTPTKEMRTTS